jgi:spore germination cell wall hydrolase CwlJ-like protein
MVTHNNSILPRDTEDNYILSTKGLEDISSKAKFYRRFINSQNKHDGTSDTSSSVKEKKMIRIIKTVVFLLALALVGTAGYKVINYKLDTLKNARMNVSPVTAELRQRQLDCLARNIYHEAGYEPFEGKVAVAQVTINRAESGEFPSDICGVVYQKNIVYERVLCQFSWYCNSASVKKPMNGPVYTESMEVAKKVLLEGFRLPDLKQALYFHGDYIQPGWNKKPVAKIGRHIFYN